MNEFIITFRECLEATLIVGIVYTFLSKTNMTSQIKQLWSAVVAAIIASIGVAFLVISLNEQLENNAMSKLFEAIFMYITAALLLYVVFWLSKSISDKKKLEELASKASKSSKWGIFLLIFLSCNSLLFELEPIIILFFKSVIFFILLPIKISR